MKVFVYCNTRNPKNRLLSVKALEGEHKGKVVATVEQIRLCGAEFKVSEAGRQRVLRTRRKSVHAGVVGQVEALWGATIRRELDNRTIKGLAICKPFLPMDGVPVRYNPYETATFVRADNGAPIKRAARVQLEVCTMLAEGVS